MQIKCHIRTATDITRSMSESRKLSIFYPKGGPWIDEVFWIYWMIWTWVSTIFCRYLTYQQHFIPLTILFTLLQWLSKTFGCETTSLYLNIISRIIHNMCILLLNLQLSYVSCSNGSVLGPLLFTMHTAEVGEIICEHRLPHHSYADDVHILGVCILDGRELLKTSVSGTYQVGR